MLVVGAGPTGLMLACELARHGAPVRIIDRLPGIVRLARATGVHSRSLEVFQDLGIVQDIVERAALVRGANQFAGGEPLLHYRTDELDSPFPFGASLEQWKVEEALEGLLNRLGVEVDRETELRGLEARADGVVATLRGAGDEETVETPWLIGCDGAHSTVRHLLGECFPGTVDPREYLVADVQLEHGRVSDEIYVYLTDDGVLWWFPLPEGRSLLAGDLRQPGGADGAEPALADVQGLLDRRAPAGIVARDARWINRFHIHYRLAPHYRNGRVFLAGDAAHVHSPIGGQGMNTGIQDAYNLGWKLALVARGEAPARLLDSYEAERRAVARNVLEMTRGLTEKAEQYVALEPDERSRLYRHLVLPDAERLHMLRHAEELDLDYGSSPICGEFIEGPGALADGPAAGHEARDAGPLLLDGKRRFLFELLGGARHHLLLLPGSEPTRRRGPDSFAALLQAVSASYGGLLNVYVGIPPAMDPRSFEGLSATAVHDAQGELHRRYGAGGACLYLIRPDGYVGFRSQPPTAGPLLAYLQRLLAPA